MCRSPAHRLRARGLPVPIQLISPVGAASLSQASMLVEYVDARRQRRALSPDSPFDFAELQRTGALRCLSQLETLAGGGGARPSIMLASHPSLRLGDAPRILNAWKHQVTARALGIPCERPRPRGGSSSLIPLPPLTLGRLPPAVRLFSSPPCTHPHPPKNRPPPSCCSLIQLMTTISSSPRSSPSRCSACAAR